MKHERRQDWDPRSAEVLRDQRAACDEMRERCPVAYSDFLGWSLFRHDDIMRVLNDPETFSNAVSRHLSVPDGMDPPRHTEYRRLIERYFERAGMARLEPRIRGIAANLIQPLVGRDAVEAMNELAHPFAVQVQCAFLGWPAELHEPLRQWTRKNQHATLAADRGVMEEVAREFEGYVGKMLDVRRAAGAWAGDDVTAGLLQQQLRGRPLKQEEIVSILRNWTVGEVGTISAALGIVAHHLAQDAALQQQLRGQPALLPAAVEEMLRLFNPLVSNRRITTKAVVIGGRRIEAGERITLIWLAANRDPRAFPNAGVCDTGRDQSANLLYGAGIHACPGAPLARMELRVVLEELLLRTAQVEVLAGYPPVNAAYPASGFAELYLRLR